jgi:hypothetical protein
MNAGRTKYQLLTTADRAGPDCRGGSWCQHQVSEPVLEAVMTMGDDRGQYGAVLCCTKYEVQSNLIVGG